MAVPFDPDALEVRGAPVRVIEGVLQSFDGAAQVSVSETGHVVYAAGRFGSSDRQLLSVDRSGAVIPFAAPPQPYASPRISPDGQQLVVAVSGSTDALWRYEIPQGRLTQLAFEGSNAFPVWHPSGRRLAFSSTRAGVLNLFVQTLDVTVAPERLAPSESAQVSGSWSADGQLLLYTERHPNTGRDIWILPTFGDRTPYSFLTTEFDESAPRPAPDGSTVAYVSNESGQNEVYLRSLRAPSQVQRVSVAGGTEPVWAPGGRELFYRSGAELMSVSIDAATARAGAARTILSGSFVSGSVEYANYDVTPDGLRFVMIRDLDRGQPEELRVILNWLSPGAQTPTVRRSEGQP
jgi:TolB protein